MLEQITPRKFDEWMAYCQVEPFGEEWYQTGLTNATLCNVMGKKKGGGVFKPQEFMPRVVKRRSEEEQQQLHLQQWQMYVARAQAGSGGLGSSPPSHLKLVSPDDELDQE
jgi:hypothetical protein